MRQLERTIEEKAHEFDNIVTECIHQYNDEPPVEKAYHSRAEKIGYMILENLNKKGFTTNAGIQGQ